jgi:hypothetical protein
MDQMKIYILYAFGILMCVVGVIYLASEYIKYLSDAGKLTILMLMVIMFASFGKYFEEGGL